MPKQRRKHSAQFKFKIALEAVREIKTIAQISSEYGVHANQISKWKKQLLDHGVSIFSRNGHKEAAGRESLEADLFEQIGRLKMELEWLKKKAP